MIKAITLKMHCATCSSLLYNKPTVVIITGVNIIPFVNKAVSKLFPDMHNCKRCGSNKLDKSYTYVHHEKIQTDNLESHEKEINRCKAQIAATWDENSDIYQSEREIIRECFQKRLQQLLNLQNISA